MATRRPSRGREREQKSPKEAPTADEQLEQLIQEAEEKKRQKARSEAPAVRAVKAEVRSNGGQPSSSSGGELVLAGLSPEQQSWLVRAAQTLRAGGEVQQPEALMPPTTVGPPPGFTVPESSLLGPLGRPVTYAPLDGSMWGKLENPGRERGDLRDLGRSSTIPGRDQGEVSHGRNRGGDLVRRRREEVEEGGRMHSLGSVVANLFPDSTSRRESRQRGTPGRGVPPPQSPVPTVVGNGEVNPFWSESLKRGLRNGGVGQEEMKQERDAGQQEDRGLTQKDVEELEEMRLRGQRELDMRIMEEAARRNAGPGTGSYKSIVTAKEAQPEGQAPTTSAGGNGMAGESLTESLRSLEP